MKHLPLQLGIAVILLFTAVIASCLLWTPGRIKYYVGKLRSDNPKERVAAVDGLLGMGGKGVEALTEVFGGGKEEAEFLSENWKYYNRLLPDDWWQRSPLHFAVKRNFYDSTQLLIDRGAIVNLKSHYGRTPLDLALEYEHERTINLLRAHGGKTGEELKKEAGK
jgi:hypothetical protein